MRGFVPRARAQERLEFEGDPALAEREALERADQRLLAAGRRRLREGRYSAAGLLKLLERARLECSGAAYDELDALVAGLLKAEAPGDPQVSLAPEMVAYQPTPVRVILDLLALAQLQAEDVLVDLGSGLGQVPILVSLLSPASALGIEIEAPYHDYAVRSAHGLGLTRARFIHADAREADLTTGTVFYLYTPFRGAMWQEVLGRLKALPGPIRICGYGPCLEALEGTPWLRRTAGVLGPGGLAVFGRA